MNESQDKTDQEEQTPREETKDFQKMEEELNRREKLLQKKEELLAREENLRSQGGRSSAGARPIIKSEEEIWAEEARERYAGTGLDPTDDNSETVYS